MSEIVKSLSRSSRIFIAGQKRSDIKNPVKALPRIDNDQRMLKSITYIASSLRWGLRLVKRKKIKLIYARHGISTVPAIMLGKITGIPTLVEVNGLLSEETQYQKPVLNSLISSLDKLASKKATGLIAVTQGLKEYLLELNQRPGKEITVIPNGTNTKLFRPMNMAEARKAHGLGDGKLIVFVGTLAPWQGIPFLIEAVELLKHEDFTVLIVGSGPIEGELREMVKNKQLDGKIKFTGPVEYKNIPGYINCGDICVAPFTINRNMKIGLSPLKVYEYGACGKPVIASRIKNLEFIEQENIGRLVEPENPEALAEAIKSMLGNPEQARTMSQNARKLMEEQYNWDCIARRIQVQIDNIIDLHG